MIQIKRSPKVKLWQIVNGAVENGASFAVSRFNKYATAPLSESAQHLLRDHIEREIMNALSDVLEFDHE